MIRRWRGDVDAWVPRRHFPIFRRRQHETLNVVAAERLIKLETPTSGTNSGTAETTTDRLRLRARMGANFLRPYFKARSAFLSYNPVTEELHVMPGGPHPVYESHGDAVISDDSILPLLRYKRIYGAWLLIQSKLRISFHVPLAVDHPVSEVLVRCPYCCSERSILTPVYSLFMVDACACRTGKQEPGGREKEQTIALAGNAKGAPREQGDVEAFLEGSDGVFISRQTIKHPKHSKALRKFLRTIPFRMVPAPYGYAVADMEFLCGLGLDQGELMEILGVAEAYPGFSVVLSKLEEMGIRLSVAGTPDGAQGGEIME